MRFLFVCTGNSFRSPVAEALTRKYTPHEAESAGTSAADHVAENAKELLEEDGALQFVKPAPEQVSQGALDRADRVIAMTSSHKEYLVDTFDVSPERIEVWGVEDPVSPGVEPGEAFDGIEERVKELQE